VALSRREFSLSLAGAALAARLAASDSTLPWAGPATVRKIFLAVPQPTWPRPDLDVAAEKAEVDATLTRLEQRHSGAVRFTGGDLVRTEADAQAVLRSIRSDEDALLIADLTSGTSGLLRVLRDVSVPVLLYARPYSGWSYVDVAQWAQSGRRADLVVTSDPAELDPYMPLFRTIHHLRNSKVLVVSPARASETAAAFTKQFGTAFSFPGYGPLKAAFDSASPVKARKQADAFVRAALKVVEPRPQEITDSFRLYDAVLRVLDQEKANAITVDCLGGFRRGDLPAYPCVAWARLNDGGRYGVCEADVPSTMTQLLLTSFSGKPGFVSDPVFDTGRNEVIHAHCVSATKLLGIGGAVSPYSIRSHMEDNRGVSIQVSVPEAETVTVAKFIGPTTLAVSTGEVVSNVDDPRGCRTKFRTRVANSRRMLEEFTGGLHRVVFFGNYEKPVERMGRLMGFKVLHEG
jgi:hypothetical protein